MVKTMIRWQTRRPLPNFCHESDVRYMYPQAIRTYLVNAYSRICIMISSYGDGRHVEFARAMIGARQLN
jgi:hypothetical protein